MKHPNFTALVFCILLLAALPSLAAQQKHKGRGPSTPDERKHAVEMTALLEAEPLAPEAKQLRKSLWYWLASIPDIKVNLCASLIGDLDQNGVDFGSELVAQLAFAQARFIIEHPDEAGDESRIYLAGVEGVLKTYANLKKAKPKFRIYLIEALREKQQKGHLGRYVKSAMEACRKAASPATSEKQP